ncbi:MAG: AMP-binding protein [Novosphingobium sp.]|jgi:fatty-acyl-CoA synthase|nr:AMP-binding protein [Novosphingobium sp.]
MPGHHPSRHALTRPDHPAMVIADTGEVLTYRALDEGSNRFARLLRSLGLKPGDRIAAMLCNSTIFPIVYWGATRCGVFITLLSTHLKPAEAAYIIGDSGSRVLVLSGSLGETPRMLAAARAELIGGVERIYHADDAAVAGADSLTAALAAMPASPVDDEISGFHMIYSSGTTGRPKGVVLPFTPGPIDEFNPLEGGGALEEGAGPPVVFNAGPLYHGMPLSCMVVPQRLGGTAVTLSKFDAEAVLKAIETWQVTEAQFVPTMFVRLLALPDEVRAGYDISSLKKVIHAAAPCPVEIKRRMIAWFGPIIYEYYSSTEGVGVTGITSEEWLRKPGSVGRSAMGPIHICDEDGRELSAGESGLIYFEVPQGRAVAYLNDTDKTKRAAHPRHANWFTVGDIGRLDDDGYLFLTDRKDFMIISGGVNIYPQAVEDCLIVHPGVLDAAVIGIADPEYGEAVKAIVQPKVRADAGPELEAALRAWVSTRISRVTQPKSYEFVEELPRLPSGKLAKHELRKLYGNPVSHGRC